MKRAKLDMQITWSSSARSAMETTKDSVGELIAKKDRIESEIKELIDVLETVGG